MNVLRVHGPLTCEHLCADCDGEHHWMEEVVTEYDIDYDYEENLPDVGTPYLPCKHCAAWAEYPVWWHEDAEFTMEAARGGE